MSIRNHANELKVYQKTGGGQVDLHPLDYAIWDTLENKPKVTSHPNIGSLKIVIKEKWNKICEEFILKTCKWRPY